MDNQRRWRPLGLLVVPVAMLVLVSCAAPPPPPPWEVPLQPRSAVTPVGQVNVTDLGTLGGPISGAKGINDLGEVVGSSETTSWGRGGTGGAFIWTPADGMTDLGHLPGMGFVSATAWARRTAPFVK